LNLSFLLLCYNPFKTNPHLEQIFDVLVSNLYEVPNLIFLFILFLMDDISFHDLVLNPISSTNLSFDHFKRISFDEFWFSPMFIKFTDNQNFHTFMIYLLKSSKNPEKPYTY
jgi:hypothetical protein